MTVKVKSFTYPQKGDKMAVFSGGCKATISDIIPDNKFPFFQDAKGRGE